MIKIKKGLDLPITGAPEQTIEAAPTVKSVAAFGPDYIGMRPTMRVVVGDRVRCGQVLFTDKKNPGVRFNSPAAGVVSAIHRGAKRALLSVVIELDGDEAEAFARYEADQLDTLDRRSVQANLIESGLWTAIRTRPYSRVPAPESEPRAIFVSAMDSTPLAPSPALVIADQPEGFKNGLRVLTCLTDGKLHVGKAPGSELPIPNSDRIQVTEFDGPHPAGLVLSLIHI